jgi:dolichol-phosphate mannosyltransferase
MTKKISIVVPACNEEGNIPVLVAALKQVLDPLRLSYHLVFVDDGSTDGTLAVLRHMSSINEHIQYISLSRNFGHQNALKAGLDMADGDCVIMMDGDMQHPPELIPIMLEQWEQGNDVVYTIRKDHQDMPMMKRKTSNMFYNLINNLSDIDL